VRRHVHDGHTGNLPDAVLQVLVVGGHDVALVLTHPFHQAVVRIGALVQAGQSLESGIGDDAQGQFVLVAQLLQLGAHAVGYVGYALGVQAVHHSLHNVQLVLDAEVDEVRVQDDVIRRTQLGVVLEEQGGALLGGLMHLELVRILDRLLFLSKLIFDAGVRGLHQTFQLRIALFLHLLRLLVLSL